MNAKAKPSADLPPETLAQALTQNKEVAEDVKAVAGELAVTHAVLESAKLDVPEGDVRDAIERTSVVEKQLTETARKLDEVNAILERKTQEGVDARETSASSSASPAAGKN